MILILCFAIIDFLRVVIVAATTNSPAHNPKTKAIESARSCASKTMLGLFQRFECRVFLRAEIVSDFGGTLEGCNHAEGGAVFSLEIPMSAPTSAP